MKRMMPALTLSALLVSPHYGVDWTINGSETKTINNQTINGVDLIGGGQLSVNSSGVSTINAMRMIFLRDRASATFNVDGKLSLDLGITNISRASNSVSFNVKQNATLELTSGAVNGNKGIFRGINTTLNVNVLGGATLIGSLDSDAGGATPNNNAQSTIKIAQSGKMQGNIIQTNGILDATIEGRLEGNINANNAETKLWANQNQAPTNPKTSTITGNISIEKSNLIGEMRNLILQGSLIQNQGKSDIAFWYSQFETSTTLTNADALLHFYGTTLKSISVANGSATINLGNGSKMENYIGNANNGTINLTDKSSMLGASQTGGGNSRLEINATNSSINGAITGTSWDGKGSNLIISTTSSTINGEISNTGNTRKDKGNTLIVAKDSTITGSISQTHGNFNMLLEDSELQGGFSQFEGELGIEFEKNFYGFKSKNSTIGQGIVLTSVTPNGGLDPHLSLIQTTITNGGIKIKNLGGTLRGKIRVDSTINGGFDQTGREKVDLDFADNSTLNGGVQVRDGGIAQQADLSLGAEG